MDNNTVKRVTLFLGHYGSGKTNIAVNYALKLKEQGFETAIADLDIVNPYFRTKDSKDVLEQNGIRLIASVYAGSNVDVPALPGEIYSITDKKNIHSIVDVGGDDRGALALGRFAEKILTENDYEMLFVINKYRPGTNNADDTIEVMHEIETSAGLKFTGIINNSNIGDETTEEDVIKTFDFAKEVSEKAGLPIKFTAVKEELYPKLCDKENIFPIKIYVKQSF